MGSPLSRRKKKNQREVNEATATAFLFGCYGSCSGSVPSDLDLVKESKASDSPVSPDSNRANKVVDDSVVPKNQSSDRTAPGNSQIIAKSNTSATKKPHCLETEF